MIIRTGYVLRQLAIFGPALMHGMSVLELLGTEIIEHISRPFGFAIRLRQHILTGISKAYPPYARSGRTYRARKSRRIDRLQRIPNVDLPLGVRIGN